MPAEADAEVARLAAQVSPRSRRRRLALGVIVVIGGDTAAALLGDGRHVRVLGSVTPGTAWVGVASVSACR